MARAVAARLSRRLVSRRELERAGHHLDALQALLTQLREACRQAHERASAAEAARRHQREHVARVLAPPVERLAVRLDELARIQCAHAAAVERLRQQAERDAPGA
jgi:chromosome segregation ATPase